jgi:hypothetical protein
MVEIFSQCLFAMRSPAYGPNLAIWGSASKNGLICEENLSQFQGNVQSCPKRLRHRRQNEIFGTHKRMSNSSTKNELVPSLPRVSRHQTLQQLLYKCHERMPGFSY